MLQIFRLRDQLPDDSTRDLIDEARDDDPTVTLEDRRPAQDEDATR